MWSRKLNKNYITVWGTNVWCGLLGGNLIGPYFYDGTLNGRRYSDFLTLLLTLLLYYVYFYRVCEIIYHYYR